MEVVEICNKNNRRCSKEKGHRGRCSNSRELTFWKKSPIILDKEIHALSERKESLEFENINVELENRRISCELERTQEELKESEKELLQVRQQQHTELISCALEREEIKSQITSLEERKAKEENELHNVEKQFEKLKLLFDKRKSYACTKRERNQTDESMITSTNTTRYRRRKETKDVLEFIHGGEFGAINGAWDFLSSKCDLEKLETFISKFKRGKFLQNIYDKQLNKQCTHESEMKKAIAKKYLGHISRRRYQLMCKIQKASLNDNEDVGEHLPNNEEFILDLRTKQLSHYSVEKFVQNLDIGEVHQIEGCSGATRTVTALVTMIADVNLKVEINKERLIWFNGVEDHFVVEFSDDGAPESKEETMTIASLTLWNFENRVRSRDYHYPLHMATVQEKDEICALLWQQHCDEMLIIEGNVFIINGKKVTFEFQPSADQSWQCWAANVLPASATYPSPYANVHKSQLSHINGGIGFDQSNCWKPPTEKSRADELCKLNEFRQTLSPNLTDKARHDQELDFMADNGYRQFGAPRIGTFANRLRPEPLHLEINNWHHVLNLIYVESVRRGKYSQFLKILTDPKKENGCGLKFVGKLINEQYNKENKRMNKLEVRLIGAQAIALAQNYHRLVDSLKLENGSAAEDLKYKALSHICRVLRDIGGLMNRVVVKQSYPRDLKFLCEKYFNLFSLFFPDQCQSTVWTLGYAVPYHATKLYNEYKVGYGILSMQGKESLHSSLKQQLRNESNRSKEETEKGKWHQIMRASYVRTFYLPYHFPTAPTYHSHYEPRKETSSNSDLSCSCSRELKNVGDGVCSFCHDSCSILESAVQGKLLTDVVKVLKPMQCPQCTESFADKTMVDRHVKDNHESNSVSSKKIIPSQLNVAELKNVLKKMGKSTSGNKEMLRRRLEGLL